MHNKSIRKIPEDAHRLMKSIAEKYLEALKAAAKPGCRRCKGAGNLGYNLSKDRYIACSCTKKPGSVDSASAPEAAGGNGCAGGLVGVEAGKKFDPVQTLTIKRVKSQIRMLEARVATCAATEASVVRREEYIQAKRAAEEDAITVAKLEDQAEARDVVVRDRRELARNLEDEIAEIRRRIDTLLAAGRGMELDARKLREEAAEVERASKKGGALQRWAVVERRANQKLHVTRKKGREALKKIESLKEKLDRFYPGHEEVE